MSIKRTFTNWLTNYDDKKSIASKIRARRIFPLLNMIEEVSWNHSSINIIDVGGEERYWNIIPRQFLDEHNVHITIVNLPDSLKFKDHGLFKYVASDCCDLSAFDDNAFHIAHSNSVLEHVGNWERMIQFAKELTRVSQKFFIQTPNYWFPVEPHFMTPFFHWLPLPAQIWLASHIQLGSHDKLTSVDESVRMIQSTQLLNRRMLKELFKDAHIQTERFFWLPKSFIAIKK